MQHYTEISRDSVRPFLLFFFLPSYARFVLPPRLPFRAVSPHPSANYAVVVTSCHVVIKLHLPTTRHDCYQAFDSRGDASSRSSAPIVTFRNPFAQYGLMWPSMDKYGIVWTSLVKYGQVWPSIDKYGPIWPNIIQHGQVWTSIDKYGPIWSLIVNYSQVWRRMAVTMNKCGQV